MMSFGIVVICVFLVCVVFRGHDLVRFLFGGGEVHMDHVLHAHLEGRDEAQPDLDPPVHMRDPSKNRVEQALEI